MTETWFDTRDGKMLIGEDAVEPRLMGAGPGDVMPLAELLESEDFAFDANSYPRNKEAEWDRDRMLEFGRWALKVVNSGNPDPENVHPLKYNHIVRLNLLRLGPNTGNVSNEFGPLWSFRAEIGSPLGWTVGKYDDWSLQDYVAYAAGIAEALGRKPTADDFNQAYREGKGPGYQILQRRAGGVSNLNEHLGFPNIHSWDEDDYISWGVRVMDVNGGLPLNENIIDVLSRRKAGPSSTSVKRKFGGKGAKFKELVEQERELQLQTRRDSAEERLQKYWSFRQAGELPARFDDYSDDYKVIIVSKYIIARRLLNQFDTPPQEYRGLIHSGTDSFVREFDVSPREYHRLATTKSEDFIEAIRKINPTIAPGQIELIADEIGALEDIWPIAAYQDRLKVTKSDLLKIKDLNRQANAKSSERRRLYYRRRSQLKRPLDKAASA